MQDCPAEKSGSRCVLAFCGDLRRAETPSEQVAGVKADAEEVGGDEPELRSADADDADDGTVDGGDDPALPKFPANEDGGKDGQDAGDVIQTNVVEPMGHFVFMSRR